MLWGLLCREGEAPCAGLCLSCKPLSFGVEWVIVIMTLASTLCLETVGKKLLCYSLHGHDDCLSLLVCSLPGSIC